VKRKLKDHDLVLGFRSIGRANRSRPIAGAAPIEDPKANRTYSSTTPASQPPETPRCLIDRAPVQVPSSLDSIFPLRPGLYSNILNYVSTNATCALAVGVGGTTRCHFGRELGILNKPAVRQTFLPILPRNFRHPRNGSFPIAGLPKHSMGRTSIFISRFDC
jgi:hypothetical protein